MSHPNVTEVVTDGRETSATYRSLQKLTTKIESTLGIDRVTKTPETWWLEAYRRERSGESRIVIARKLGKDHAVISRVLGTSSKNIGQLAKAALMARATYLKFKAAGYYRHLQERDPDYWEKRFAASRSQALGLKRVDGQWAAGDPEDVEKIRKAFDKRARGIYFSDIGKDMGRSPTSTRVNLRLKDHRYVEAGIITEELFQRVQMVPRRGPHLEQMKMRAMRKEFDILESLNKRPSRCQELARIFELRQPMMSRYLRKLRDKRLIEKKGHKDPYTITAVGQKVLTRSAKGLKNGLANLASA